MNGVASASVGYFDSDINVYYSCGSFSTANCWCKVEATRRKGLHVCVLSVCVCVCMGQSGGSFGWVLNRCVSAELSLCRCSLLQPIIFLNYHFWETERERERASMSACFFPRNISRRGAWRLFLIFKSHDCQLLINLLLSP